MRVLILGKDGQVGEAAMKLLSSYFDVLALGRKDEGGELLNLASLVAGVKCYKPEVIINAAAYTAVDKAESETQTTFAINARAPEVLAKVARELGALFIHLSTDYVFDGQKPLPYEENDLPHPLNVYGQSKYDGECLILAANPQALILRLTWVHSTGHKNFVTSLIRWLTDNDSIDVVNDQWGTPTSAKEVAKGLLAVVLAFEKGVNFDRGVYHFANGGFCHRHECAQWLKSVLEKAEYLTAEKPINAVSSDVFPSPATRPSRVILNTSKFQTTFRFKPQSWQAGVLETAMEEIQKGV